MLLEHEMLAFLEANPETASIPVIVISLFAPNESDWPLARPLQRQRMPSSAPSE